MCKATPKSFSIEITLEAVEDSVVKSVINQVNSRCRPVFAQARSFAASYPVDSPPVRNDGDPSLCAALGGIKSLGVTPQLKHHLLSHLFGLVPVPQHQSGQANDRSPGPAVKHLKSRHISPARLLQKILQ